MTNPLSLARRLGVSSLCLLGLASALAAPKSEQLFLSGHGPEDAVPWDFTCSGGRRAGEHTTIRVPSCWEQEGFGSYLYGVNVRKLDDSDPAIPKEHGLYRRSFRIPASWAGQRVRLVFEGVMTDASVKVNGVSAGPIHQGGFYEFEYDVTALLRSEGENVLEVDVARESANTSVNRAERRGDYWTFGGIYRPVWLEARPQHFIDWVALDARADGSFVLRTDLGSPAPAKASLKLSILDASGQQVGGLQDIPVDEGRSIVNTRLQVPGIKTWSAESPVLYSARLELSIDGKPAHEVSRRFGFRTIEVRPGDGLYVNGSKVRLKGVNRHCFWPETGRTVSRQQSYDDARLIREGNMNAVRMSHYPPDAHFLEACDELGLYVLDELAGWQGSYDTPTATRLIAQIVRRDVNHPSILFWDNGNEGGWNREVDSVFARHDPQQRSVLHPWELHGAINTSHYRKWDRHVELCQGPDLYMPTEFLHGLYDGGIGAGFHDYWRLMKSSPTCAGGFFWAFCDEGLVRTDRKGEIDNQGNLAPDGMVGPHREKEGSFFTVRELWSPVQLAANPQPLSPDWRGEVSLENNYDFTDLSACSLDWALLDFPSPMEEGGALRTAASGKLRAPAAAPGKTALTTLPLPADWRAHNALQLQARGPQGELLRSWSWVLTPRPSLAREDARRTQSDASASLDADGTLVVNSGGTRWLFDAKTGSLSAVTAGRRSLNLASGPALLRVLRKDKVFNDVSPVLKLASSDQRRTRRGLELDQTFSDGTNSLHLLWVFNGGPLVSLEYEYTMEGEADAAGLRLGLDGSQVKGKRWLGWGPFRTWQNRQEGPELGLWSLAYKEPIPGKTFNYPEFTGCFRDWQWLELQLEAGRLLVGNSSGIPYFGLLKPDMGENGLPPLPDFGLSLLDVIPAVGTKFNTPDQMGPQSARGFVRGTKKGTIQIRFVPSQD